MEAQSLSECNQCRKKFQRKAHLLRHQQQRMYTGPEVSRCRGIEVSRYRGIRDRIHRYFPPHRGGTPGRKTSEFMADCRPDSGDRPYACKFCAKTFKRSDVLRDHFSRCDRRGNSAIPSSLERGRKRHACDECSRLKVKCDNTVPCMKCKEFGRICVKTRPRVTGGSSPDETARNTPASTTPDPSGSDRNSIGFLLNLPGEKDFMREFPKSYPLSPPTTNANALDSSGRNGPRRSPGEENDVNMGNASSTSSYQTSEQNGVADLDAFLSNLELSTFERQTHNWQTPEENIVPWSGANGLFMDQDVLKQRAFDIQGKLKYTAATMNVPHLPSKEIMDAIELITGNTIADYIKLYFRHWHKHAPVIHEASFNPCTVALPLLLALYSKETKDVVALKSILDIIESYIYSVPGLNDEYELPGRLYVKQGETSSPDWQQYQLEEFQGAYLMIVLQYWTGNPVARTRVRQQRFTRIISIYHALELQTLQHPPSFVINDEHTFKSWIRTESFIRTAGLAMMLDNAFGIFNNVAPRLQWAEIDLSFPSDDAFFRIANYEEFVANSRFLPRKIKIKEAFLLLFSSPETAGQDLRPFRTGNLTALDMQMLIHLLYTHVWTHTFSNPLVSLLPSTSIPALLQPFKTALQNWKFIWDDIKNRAPESEWQKLGFQRTAETYYAAVQHLIGVFEKRQGRFPLLPSDCEKGLHLKRLLSL
ncbi:hypothetical protein B7494_g8583 [Chlorociboria aeruginascens]|nr:hypothetical protein B7494_g8583 [Chlorociboria aeruginascens]